MSDNVTLNPGVGGAVVRTKDRSGVEVQVVGVDLNLSSSSGSEVLMTGRDAGDGQGALYVDPRPLDGAFAVTPTISASSAYAAGDCVGGIQTLTGAARASGLAAVVQSICVLDKTQGQRATLDLMFFVGASAPTSAGDNAPVAFSDSDMANCRGIIPIGPYNTLFPGTPLNSYSTLAAVGLKITTVGSSNIYVQAVTRTTPTYSTTSDLVFFYEVDQN